MNKKKELLDILKEMYANIDKMPPDGMMSSVNHYDLSSLLLLLVAWFEADLNDSS
jgi:hypothetical protein